ncbi:unnamed protein product [Adineta steineri]|uniref:Uncharacterized protein n=1 Tax=Adineta steineri TaxID=433720 RepID=A0A814FDJ7_9BILA|nr:unnamed protein product [Adineta steineri]CAF0981391.1 unnamed protein product [Adineta steineri]CAF1095323.1 unnamed protein product [Adineta steineri]
MKDRIHMQVISDNYRQIPSVAFQRRQSVPVNSSLRLVQVLKLPRQCHHQSLKIQLIERHPNQKEFTDLNHQNDRKQKRKYLKYYCVYLPLCIYLLMISLICLGTIIAAIVIGLLSLAKTTTTTATTTSEITTVTTTSIITTTQTTAIPCSPSCNSEQTCIQNVCTNVGYLACTLTWSRPGDGDIVVTTPSGKTICYTNRGPSNATDQGELDRDDQVGEGPENVYWPSNGTLPPTGTYYVCFEPYQFNNPIISIINPITVIYRIVRPSSPTLIFTRTFTSTITNSYNCNITSNTLIGSFNYP